MVLRLIGCWDVTNPSTLHCRQLIHSSNGNNRSFVLLSDFLWGIGRIKTTCWGLWMMLNESWILDRYFCWIISKLTNIFKVEDWYSITLTDLKEAGFPATVGKSKLVQLLSDKYPEHNWDKIYLLRGKYAQQKRLEKAVRSLFPVPTHITTYAVTKSISTRMRSHTLMQERRWI